MKVFLPQLDGAPVLNQPADDFKRLAQADRFKVHEIVEEPDQADLVLFTQCHMLPTDWRLDEIVRHPVARRFRSRVMVYNERDRPWCVLPGVYASMPSKQFNPRYQRAWGYYRHLEVGLQRAKPDLLFSFVGSPSASCREPLFSLRHPQAIVEEVRRFTFYEPEGPRYQARRSRYQEILARSRFVLCPRGRGTSSLRLYETLAAGRVPVIISDDWVPPVGPAWETFSLRWPEKRIAGLIELLEKYDSRWEGMSAAAADVYREWFAEDVEFHRIVELCCELRDSRALACFPSSGVKSRAFFEAGLDTVRWRSTSVWRRAARRIVTRLGFVKRNS
jgi:hypothetical protein